MSHFLDPKTLLKNGLPSSTQQMTNILENLNSKPIIAATSMVVRVAHMVTT